MKVSLVIALLLIMSGCDMDAGPGGWASNAIPETFSSNGERIYFTGVSKSGNPITASSNDFHMSMHRQIHGGGCATCHGSDKEGSRLMPKFWKKAPALTSNALFGDNSEGHDDSEAHAHETYTPRTLRLAITEGVNPSGHALDTAMPRWSMNEADLDDLISYLQQ